MIIKLNNMETDSACVCISFLEEYSFKYFFTDLLWGHIPFFSKLCFWGIK